jgi:hypothetical protein
VLQQPFYDYVSRAFQTAHIVTARGEDSVHFHIYHCVEFNHQFRLTLSERRSTNVLGIERMLKLGKGAGISEEEVIQRIKAKLPGAVQLQI